MNETDKHPMKQAYYRMLQRVYEKLLGRGSENSKRLGETIDEARQHAIELGEIESTDAVKIGDYLKRDVEDFILLAAKTSDQAKRRVQEDLSEMERDILGKLLEVADQTTVELNVIRAQARMRQEHEWEAGDMSAPRELECKGCGKIHHHHRPGPIGQCEQCGHRRYRRGKMVH